MSQHPVDIHEAVRHRWDMSESSSASGSRHDPGDSSSGSGSRRAVFPLRFRSARLRTLVRDVAARERISQNELIEQAVAHEVVARGALLAEDLAAAAQRLEQAAGEQLDALIARSVDDFARGEQLPDPLRSYRLSSDDAPTPGSSGELPAAIAAFRGAVT